MLESDAYGATQPAWHDVADEGWRYVIAHEVGHHLQNLMGTSAKLDQARQRVSERDYNALSVRLELQADCYAGVWAMHSQQSKGWLEQGDIEERGILEAGLGPVARMGGPDRNGDLFGNFETPAKSVRDLAKELRPERLGGELVEGKVSADGRENLGVFLQARLFEELLRKTPAGLVALGGVDLAEPAFVLPGAGTDPDVFGRKFAQAAA